MDDKNTAEKIGQDLEILRKWVKDHLLLPDEIDEYLLRRFHHSCYYDIEKTKKCIEIFFTTRTACAEILDGRDPCSEEMKTAMEITNVAYLKTGSTDLMLWQLNDPGMERYDYVADIKLFFMTSDAWLLDNPRLEKKVIILLDAKDVSMKFLSTFKFSVAKKIGQYQQEAMPLRLKEVHVINAPNFIDKLFSVMKPFISTEIARMVHFHKPNSDTLFKYVSKEDLPEDFGGKLPKMEELMKETIKSVMSKRETLLRNDLWRAKKYSKTSKADKKNVSCAQVPDPVADGLRALAID